VRSNMSKLQRVSGTPKEAARVTTGVSVYLLLIAVNIVVYLPVLGYGFVNFDDPQYVYENPVVSRGLTWSGVRWAFTTKHDGNWFPLTWLSHLIDVQMYGVNAGGHHFTNLILHIATTLILFRVLKTTTGASSQSAFVAVMFAIHPLQMESVAWIAERKNVLSTLFWILTIGAYASYARQPRRTRYIVVLCLFALGLMTKPMLVTLPFTLLLFDIWPLKRKFTLRLIWEKLPMFGLAIASCILTLAVQKRAIIPLEVLPFNLRLANAVLSYVRYIGKMFWPARLGVFYTYPAAIPTAQAAGAFLILIAASITAFLLVRNHPYLLVGWLWCLGTLTPVIGLVQVGNQAMADRYAYVPLIGILIMVAWGAPQIPGMSQLSENAMLICAVVCVALCATVAHGQAQVWAGSTDLWEHALEVSPGNHFALTNLADAYAKQGRTDEAIARYRQALRIKPDAAQPHYNLANVLANRGRLDEAVEHYTEALRLRPNDAAAHNNLANALAQQGRAREAAEHFSAALEINPDPLVHYNLAIILERLGQRAEAVQHLEAALRLEPDLPQAQRALRELKSPAP
jgi:protein O-mannosyl-transferase